MISHPRSHGGDSNPNQIDHVLDERILKELRDLGGEDDPGLLAELIDIFLQDAPQRMSEISNGLKCGDLKIVERAAHTLKSSSANIGALGLSSVCRQMEQIARERKSDGIQALVNQSQQMMKDVDSALRAYKP
jgi:HPt (histidine-containing phosphotransfer) domain-containing protein